MARSKQVLALASLNVGHRRPITPAQSRQTQNLTAASHAWAALAHSQRAPWQLLANQMTHETGLRTPAGLRQKRPLNAFQAFASVNATRLALGLAVNTSAPAAPVRPAAVPPVLLIAVEGGRTGLSFDLTLTLPAYADTLQVYAAPPQLAGQYPVASGSAVIIATLASPAAGPNDLSDAYNARFGPLSPGQQVCLTLVPVSAAGFKGTPLALSADVAASAQPAVRQGDAPPAKLKAA